MHKGPISDPVLGMLGSARITDPEGAVLTLLQRIRLTCLLAATLLFSSAASADPIQVVTTGVTGGVFSGSDGSVNDFSIFGPGFTLGGIAGSDAFGEPHWRCGLCQPGDQLSLSSRYESFGGIEFNGKVYENVTGYFDFESDTITLPNLPPGQGMGVGRWFTFRGEVMGLGSTRLDLVGRGLASLSLVGRGATAFENAHIDATSVWYLFDDAAPVPEPGTLLLVGGGLVGAIVRKRMRTKPSRTREV